MYRAITGEVPIESMDRLAEDLLVPPSGLGVAIEPQQEQAILNALALRARDRYRIIEEFQSALMVSKKGLQEEKLSAETEAEKHVGNQDDEKVVGEKPEPELKKKLDHQSKLHAAYNNKDLSSNKKMFSYISAVIAGGLLVYGGISFFEGGVENDISEAGIVAPEEDNSPEEGKIDFYGETYTGQLLHGMPDGFGTWENPDGGIYEGEWKDGMAHGQGIYIWANGDRYEGERKDDLIHGQGKYVWADGYMYEGEHKDGHMHGQGIMVMPDGDRYEGEWKDDLMHGQGVYTWADGEKHEGEFKDGLAHGYGVYTWADGYIYEGEFKDDLMHGQGTMVTPDGYRYDGVWQNGEQVGE